MAPTFNDLKNETCFQGQSKQLALTVSLRAQRATLTNPILIFVSTSLGYKMKKRVGAIEEFTFLPLTEGRQLHITIAITGWLASGKYREDRGQSKEG